MTTSDFGAPTLIDGYATMGIDSLRALIGFNRVPPDHNGAVGTTHVVSVFNHALQVFDKSGNLQSTTTLDSLFGTLAGTLPVDPNIMYDAAADRFVYVSFEIVGSDAILNPGNDQVFLNVAVSKTGDPADGWHVTQINAETMVGGANGWSDFPSIAVDGDNIYITANMFAFDGGGAFLGNRVWIVDKGEGEGGLYDGGAASFTAHDPVGSAIDATGLGVGNGTYIAARIEDVTGADSGIYLVSADSLVIGSSEYAQVIRVDVGPGGPTFTARSINLGDISINGPLPPAPQRGSGQRIASGDGRIWSGGAVERDGKLYFAFDVAATTGFDAGDVTVHWVMLDAANPAALSLVQQGNVGGEDIAPDTHTFMPSIAVNKDGTILINFSASGPLVFPGAYYAIRAANDPAGVFGPSQTLAPGLDHYYRTRAGEGISGQNVNRWGDFSGVSVDPSDGTTFFFFNMYADARGSANTAGQDGRWRLTVGEARATIKDFLFLQGEASEAFHGGLGRDGLTVQSGNAAALISVAQDGAGVRIAFGTGEAASAFDVETIRVAGGAGADTISISPSLSAATLAAVKFTLAGGAGDDTLTGGAGDDVLTGGAGADRLSAGAGADTLDYSDSAVRVVVRLWNQTATGGVAAGDVISGFEHVTGGSAGDAIVGADLIANLLVGGDGDDAIQGLSGYDTLRGGRGADNLNGGSGIDTLDYSDALNKVIVRLWNQTATGDIATGDVISGFERVIGGSAGDAIVGSDGVANYIAGNGGADFIQGLGGADTLIGGAGNDTLTGGTGADRFEFRRGDGIDRITDFGAGDVIRLVGVGVIFDTFAEILAATTQVGANAVIALSGGATITLVGVSKASLAPDDFLFS